MVTILSYVFWAMLAYFCIFSSHSQRGQICTSTIHPRVNKNPAGTLLTGSWKRALFQLQKSTSYEPKIGAEMGALLSSCQQGIILIGILPTENFRF